MVDIFQEYIKKRNNRKSIFDDYVNNEISDSNFFDKDIPEIQTPDSKSDASLGQMGAALAAEIAIAEGGRTAGAVAGGPIGFVIGGIASGAYGSFVAQKMVNPENISLGRIIADSFINLIPGAKAKKGTNLLKDVATRQAGIGATVSAGGITGEIAIDEGRAPTIEELTNAGFTGALLGAGLGLTGAGFNRVYSKIQGLEDRDITKLINSDPEVKSFSEKINNLSKKQYDNFLEQNKEGYLSFRERFDDANIRQLVIQDEVAGGQYSNKKGILKVEGDDEVDYYLKKRLSEGKIEYKTENIVNINNKINENLTQKAIKAEISTEELSKKLDDILHAKHALNVNARLGDGKSGMSNVAAKTMLSEAEKRGFMKLLDPEIKELGYLSKQILDTAVDGGLVSKEIADQWRKERPDYVPLTRIMEETDVPAYFTPRNVYGEINNSGIKQMKGSNLEVGSIRQNINESLAQMIRRSEVNKANLAFKRLLDKNKNVANEIVNVTKENTPYYKMVKSKNGYKFEENVTPSDTTLSIFEDGKRFLVSFKDPNLARAFKGRPVEQTNSIIQGLVNAGQWINRNLGSLYTRFNPEFLVPNLTRDRTEAFVNNMAKMGYKGSGKILNPKEIATDMSIIRNKTKGIPAKDAQQEKLYRLYDQFREDGGAVGGLGLSTAKQVDDKIKDLEGLVKDGTFLRSSDKQKLNKLSNIVNDVNRYFEDGTRFGTYRMMIDKGYSRDKASLAARNSSFDPKLGGTDVSLLRATYLFANPAIQANKVLFKNILTIPKVATATLSTLVALTSSLDFLNSTVDSEWEEKLKSTSGSDWLKNKNLIFVTGKDEKGQLNYISIPIGYAIVPFKFLADKLQKAVLYQQIPDKFAKEASSEFADTLNPFGASLVPTPVRPYIELIQNEDGLGRAIRPEWLESNPASETVKIFPWTAKTWGGEMAMATADSLKNLGYETSPENIKYLASTYFGGPGALFTRISNVASKLYNGKNLSPRDIPIARRFYGESYKEAFDLRAGKFSEIDQIDSEDETQKAKDTRVAYNIFKTMQDAKPSERRKVFIDEINANRKNINASVIRKIEKRIKNAQLGLSSVDVRVKNLSIEKRAEYLINELKNKTIPDIQKYIKEQQAKGILTDNVKQIMINSKDFQDIKLRKIQ